MLDLVLGHLPLWLTGLGGIGLAFLVWRHFGLRAVAAVGVAVLLAMTYRRGRDAGYEARGRKEKKDADRAVRAAAAARARADRRNADPRRLYDDDGFRRD